MQQEDDEDCHCGLTKGKSWLPDVQPRLLRGVEVTTSCLHRLGSDSKMPTQAWMPVVEVREKRGVGEGCKHWNDMVEVAVGEMTGQDWVHQCQRKPDAWWWVPKADLAVQLHVKGCIWEMLCIESLWSGKTACMWGLRKQQTAFAWQEGKELCFMRCSQHLKSNHSLTYWFFFCICFHLAVRYF